MLQCLRSFSHEEQTNRADTSAAITSSHFAGNPLAHSQVTWNEIMWSLVSQCTQNGQNGSNENCPFLRRDYILWEQD